MCSEPVLLGEQVIREELKLLAASRPPIEVIAAPPLGSDQHVRGALTLRIAVKTSVLGDGRKNRPGIELISIRQAGRHAVLIQIVRCGLGNERAYIDVLRAE